MSKFTCLVLCIVSTYIYVAEAETLRESLKPVLSVCAEEFGVTDADLAASSQARTSKGIPPCFFECLFKKTGFFSEDGQYHQEVGLKSYREFIKDDEQFNKVKEAATSCTSVNDKALSEGIFICERAALVADCFVGHKFNIIL